ncbi:GHKL domain-containing protein [Chitinibacter bivalviorum]|uniref:histidine kinase n=1 Tax=Chitinibacter bivalviorum TaxID=2739434 RepID=A0A7H9BI91_9NEIS|nr:ATP-binding protein [Chitinibacter bivalviorum]QLG87264.1 GHKL domain-containing protein [Chitinibacter bivalviorum]
MASEDQQINSKELEEAFALFTEASHQLSNAYAVLQQDVASLTEQLAVANGNLKQQYEEKAVLSRRLSLLLDRLPAGVLEVSELGLIVRCNERALDLLGRSLDGLNWDEFFYRHFTVTSETTIYEFNAEAIKKYFTIEQVKISEEAVSVVLLHDVSSAVEMREILARNERLVAMGQMAAGLAHQLRTPMAAALLYVGHLQREQLLEADRIKFAAKATERLKRLEVLVQNMLLFVRGQPQEVSSVSIGEVVQDALAEVRSIFEPSGLQIDLQNNLVDTKVLANFKELSGAIGNLLENACQASKPGQHVICKLELNAGQVEISIIDSGVGIPKATLERLFEPFFTTRKGGTGLGLAIVRNLISSYGGEVSVTSTPNFGSVFKICLPRVLEATNVSGQG